MAVLAPMPSASESVATAKNPGFSFHTRRQYFKSPRECSSQENEFISRTVSLISLLRRDAQVGLDLFFELMLPAGPAEVTQPAHRVLLLLRPQHARDGLHQPVPPPSLLIQVVPAGGSDAVVLRLAVVFRSPPKRGKQPALLEAGARPDTETRARLAGRSRTYVRCSARWCGRAMAPGEASARSTYRAFPAAFRRFRWLVFVFPLVQPAYTRRSSSGRASTNERSGSLWWVRTD
jgi:hypothetical protein